MDENTKVVEIKLLPKEASLLEYYFMGSPKWKCAKLAKYKSKNKRSLANTCTRIVSKYVSQAGKDEVSQRAGGHIAAWWRDLLWVKKQARAKRDLKNMVAALKMQGEAIGVLKAKEFEAEKGATIIINSAEKVEKKKPDKPKPTMKLLSFPTSGDEESD